jgi:hypothetical protein
MSTTIAAAPKQGRGRVLTVWTLEDKAFWDREGDVIAARLRACRSCLLTPDNAILNTR